VRSVGLVAEALDLGQTEALQHVGRKVQATQLEVRGRELRDLVDGRAARILGGKDRSE